MRRLLRGILDCGGGISREGLSSNYQKLCSAKLEWVQPADRSIFKYVTDFYNRQQELPSIHLLFEFFGKIEDQETIERLKDIQTATPYEDANYSWVLKTLLEDQHRQALSTAVKEIQEIATTGMTVGHGKEQKKISGVKEAILHFQRVTAELLLDESDAKTRGNIRAEAPQAYADLLKAQANPDKAVGKLIGIQQIDTVCKGAKPGELWTHAAFAGELKTLTALNWCYQLVTRYMTNVFYTCLEMPFVQLRNIICVMHSTHRKWVDQGFKPLEYRKVRDGGLTSAEVAFFKMVTDDFYSNPGYGQFETWCPDHGVTVANIRQQAEAYSKQADLGFLVLDHTLLIDPVEHTKDNNHNLNTIIRDSKKLALHFNRGNGIPVLLLHQINRQGKDDADKNEGRYKLRALSTTNEAERSSDVVTTSYLNEELRGQGQAVYCNLKNRDNPFFPPLRVGVDFSTRRFTRVFEAGENMTSGPDGVESILARL